MSERDELEFIISGARSIGCVSDYLIADATLAAGYRRIPDDCVVVSRSDLEDAVDAMQYVSEYLQKKWGYDEIRERIWAALSATRLGTDNE